MFTTFIALCYFLHSGLICFLSKDICKCYVFSVSVAGTFLIYVCIGISSIGFNIFPYYKSNSYLSDKIW